MARDVEVRKNQVVVGGAADPDGLIRQRHAARGTVVRARCRRDQVHAVVVADCCSVAAVQRVEDRTWFGRKSASPRDRSLRPLPERRSIPGRFCGGQIGLVSGVPYPHYFGRTRTNFIGATGKHGISSNIPDTGIGCWMNIDHEPWLPWRTTRLSKKERLPFREAPWPPRRCEPNRRRSCRIGLGSRSTRALASRRF